MCLDPKNNTLDTDPKNSHMPRHMHRHMHRVLGVGVQGVVLGVGVKYGVSVISLCMCLGMPLLELIDYAQNIQRVCLMCV